MRTTVSFHLLKTNTNVKPGAKSAIFLKKKKTIFSVSMSTLFFIAHSNEKLLCLNEVSWAFSSGRCLLFRGLPLIFPNARPVSEEFKGLQLFIMTDESIFFFNMGFFSCLSYALMHLDCLDIKLVWTPCMASLTISDTKVS